MLQTLRRPASERSEKFSEFSEKSSEISEAMRLVRIAAEPRPAGDSIKDAINRAAKKLGWSCSRTEDVWRGEARRIEVPEMDALRLLEQQRDFEADRAEQRRHLRQLAALRTKLEFDDPDFHAADIEAIKWVIEAAK
jgi:hypothetical protein